MKIATSSQNQSCWERLNYIDSVDSSLEDDIADTIKDNFKDNVSYRQVYKNEDPSVMYDTWIYNGNKPDQIVGWKYLVSYPYDKVQFSIGDVIYWKSIDHDNTYYPWLITSLDTQNYYDVKGHIVLCNNVLEKTTNGVLAWSYPCVFTHNIGRTDLSFGSQGVPQAQGTALVQVRKTVNTSTININDRFVLNGGTFQVTQINDHIAPNYLELYLRYVPSMEEDLVIEESENIITPQVYNIPLNTEQVYEVYNYVNGVKTNDVFEYDLNAQNQDKSNIDFITNDNGFTIRCNIKLPLPIIITCTNVTNPSTTPCSITITLGNKW